MSALITDPNIAGVDDVYERLIAILDSESIEDSLKVAVRLNLILMNHVGDRAVIAEALALAAGQPRG
jgi:hypothetical protein